VEIKTFQLTQYPGRARGNGMVIDWQQQNGLMMTSGDVPFIRVWDMSREQSIQDIPTGTDACITSLVSIHSQSSVTPDLLNSLFLFFSFLLDE